MWPKNSMLKSLWITGALLPVLLLLAACGVEVVDQTPAASTLDLFTSPLTVGSERHNLAVMAVEFDPPLSYQDLGRQLGRPHGSLGPTRLRCLQSLRKGLDELGFH